MSDPAKFPPPTDSATALQTSADQRGSSSTVGQTVLPCQKPWVLRVLAVTKDKAKGNGMVQIQAGDRSANAPFWSVKQFTETTGVSFTDIGPATFNVSAAADDWIADAPKSVTLQNGDEKIEILTLRPRPWIGFQFIEEKTNKDVPQITLSLKLPRKGETDEVYAKDLLKIESLDNGTGEVKKTLHAEVWSVEKVEAV